MVWERSEHEGDRGLLKVSRLVRKDVKWENRTTGRGEGRVARFYSYVSAMHSKWCEKDRVLLPKFTADEQPQKQGMYTVCT